MANREGGSGRQRQADGHHRIQAASVDPPGVDGVYEEVELICLMGERTHRATRTHTATRLTD